MTRILKNTTVFGMLMAVSSLANAVFLTSNTITSPVVVDFSDQATVEDAPGPIQVGGVGRRGPYSCNNSGQQRYLYEF